MSESFLGAGWAFPLRVTPGGGIARSKDEQKIKEFSSKKVQHL